MRFRLRDSFPAAHRIRVDSRGTLEPVHVHHWRVELSLSCGEPGGDTMRRARTFLSGWVARHRGRSLNEVPPYDRVNPTAERVALCLAEEAARALPDATVECVTVGEAAGFSASYRPYSASVSMRRRAT